MDDDKIWVVYRKIDYGNDFIVDDKVYLNRDKAYEVAEALNRDSYSEYYVDYLELDKN